ncbi:MAG: hypothetical protein ABIP13_06595 [Tepidiformaceae bacterium]
MTEQPAIELSTAVAQRMVSAITLAPGVGDVTICGREGEVAVSSGKADSRKEAALTRFLAQRAEAMTEDGDRRGMGRTVATSRLEQISLSGPGGDSVIIAGPDYYALVSLTRGASSTNVASAIRAIARRYH